MRLTQVFPTFVAAIGVKLILRPLISLILTLRETTPLPGELPEFVSTGSLALIFTKIWGVFWLTALVVVYVPLERINATVSLLGGVVSTNTVD